MLHIPEKRDFSRRRGFVYLAAPLASPSPEIVALRLSVAQAFTVNLANQGVAVLSPLGNGQDMKASARLSPDFNWYLYDLNLLAAAEGMIVLTLPGWSNSAGVKFEIEFCQHQSKPYSFYQPTVIPKAADLVQEFGSAILF